MPKKLVPVEVESRAPAYVRTDAGAADPNPRGRGGPRCAEEAISHTLARGATSTLPAPSPEALAELRKVLAHNDVAPWGQRVSADAATAMLQNYGWRGKSRPALDALCVKRFGRRSYARA